MMRLQLLSTLALRVLCFTNIASAFTVPSTSRRASNAGNPLFSASINDKDNSVRWIDRPRERVDSEKYSNVEIGVGRVAMVGFVGLLTNEVISGQSFGQQIVDAVVVATGHHI
eukprot:scaffold880_cov132-Cylindrotheca_fusiformis.AAC.49